VCAGQNVLVEINGNSALIVVDPQGILGQQLRPHPIHVLYITLIVVVVLSIT
jgi:hypothetical protein